MGPRRTPSVLAELAALGFRLFPWALAALMTNDAALSAAAAPLIAVAAVFQISDGIQAVGAGVLRGAGDTRFVFLANLAGHYAIGLPASIALCFALGWGVAGLWWSLCTGLSAVAVGLFARFWFLSRRALRPLEALGLEG